MALIYLIRHARPAHSGRMLGQYDSPLAGEADVSPAAVEAAHVYASPLQRARQTAQRLFPATPLTILAELAEVSLGEWDGRSWAEIETGWAEVANAKLRDWTGVVPPGGEAWPAFVARVSRAWTEIRRGPAPCAVVAHAGVNAVLAHLIDGRDPLSFQQEYGEVTSFEIV